MDLVIVKIGSLPAETVSCTVTGVIPVPAGLLPCLQSLPPRQAAHTHLHPSHMRSEWIRLPEPSVRLSQEVALLLPPGAACSVPLL